jgi:hypothetical protein
MKGIKGIKNPEMLYQTRIVLGDEYPVMGYPTEQQQMRHEAYIVPKVSARYFTN